MKEVVLSIIELIFGGSIKWMHKGKGPLHFSQAAVWWAVLSPHAKSVPLHSLFYHRRALSAFENSPKIVSIMKELYNKVLPLASDKIIMAVIPMRNILWLQTLLAALPKSDYSLELGFVVRHS